MENLYEELGIEPGATIPEIKKAHRRRVKQTHPDAGGSDEAFARTTLALTVLTDPDRRAHYDRTGEIDNEKVEDTITILHEYLGGLMKSVLQSCIKQKIDVRTIRFIGSMQNALGAMENALIDAMAANDGAAAEYEKIKGRFSTKRGTINHLDILIERELMALSRISAKNKADLEKIAAVRKYLNDCSYRTDTAEEMFQRMYAQRGQW